MTPTGNQQPAPIENDMGIIVYQQLGNYNNRSF